MSGRYIGVSYRNVHKVAPYFEAISTNLMEPLSITPDDPKTISGLDGLLLTGGSDLDPRSYGQKPVPELKTVDPERDSLEFRLLNEALSSGKLPVLAICRGMQLLNVFLGGTLIQHMVPPHPDEHRVIGEPGTRFEGEFLVNSRHHQAVQDLGEGLIVTARAEDGIIEAVELPGPQFVVAVQWHPEDRVALHERDRALFEAFAEAVRASSKSA